MTTETLSKPVARASSKKKAKKPAGTPFMALSHSRCSSGHCSSSCRSSGRSSPSFKTNDEIFADAWSVPHHAGFGAFSRAWSTANIGQDMLNTIFVVAASTFLTIAARLDGGLRPGKV